MNSEVDEQTHQEEIRQISDIVGENGRWQRKVFILAFLLQIPSCWHTLVMTFLAPNVDHWCKRTVLDSNWTLNQWKTENIPLEMDQGEQLFSKCKMYSKIGRNITAPGLEPHVDNLNFCKDWDYDHSLFTSTIVSEWNLVCDREWLVSMSQSVFMCGFLVAVLVFGQMADRYGRRPVILICIGLTNIFGILCTFSPNFLIFSILRFLIAVGTAGGATTSFVLVMEVVGPQQRTILGVGIQFGWALGYVLLSGLAWFIRDWRVLQLTISLPCLALAAYWWLLPESPRFFLTHNRSDEAEKVLENAAKENGRDVTTVRSKLRILCDLIAKENSGSSNKGTAIDLLKTPNMRKKTLIIYLNWFVDAFVYFGLSFNTNNLGGNAFMNFLLAGIVEFPSTLVTMFTLKYLGRKKPLIATMMLGGLGCLLSIPVPKDLIWMRVTVAMMGKFCIASSFATIYVYSAEIYPTVVRNVGIGISSTFARIGSIVAPFVKEIGTATNPGVPLAIFGVMSAVAGLTVVMLPETNNQPLPDTLEEGEAFGKSPEEMQEMRPLLVRV